MLYLFFCKQLSFTYRKKERKGTSAQVWNSTTSEDKAMESKKSAHKLGETIHSLLGWKSQLTSNWVKSVCDIIRSAPSEVELKKTETKDSKRYTDKDLSNTISKIEDEIAALTGHINQLNTQRRLVLNHFLDLRGNIRVFCRIRPIAIGENFGRLRPVAALDSSSVLLKLSENKSKTYSFDKVFHPGSSQDEVFAEVEPVIKSALDGYNACIFAYGQTGTGKSFTMEGIPHFPGVVPRAIEELFKQAVDSNHMFLFSFSMLEIYLGNLKDLLVPQPTKPMEPMPPCLSIQTDPKGGVEIDNLVAIQVTDVKQALKLYRLGCRFRSTASTNSNITSSRSHCLIRLSITCFNAPERRRETNKVWFIDLGGSERVIKTKASGRRLEEGKAINLSLSALGDVIHALQKKNGHIPYRNSKLTQVLKDSLGEDSKTLMLVHVSPKEEDLCETVCSLNFATRARSIHLGNTDSTEERKQKEIVLANLQQKMKIIEDERQAVRRNIGKLNEELEKLSGKAPPSNEQLDHTHLFNEFQQHNHETMRSKTKGVKAITLSKIPSFMKPTASSRRKSGKDHQTSEEKVKLPPRRRRPPLHRAESVSFPVKCPSEYTSECSISRNSCLIDMNMKSYEDNETEYSQDASECEIKKVIFPERQPSSKSSVPQKYSAENVGYKSGKKNNTSSTDFSKVDNWLHLHKNEPIISSITHKSKRILAIPVLKKQTSKGKKEDNFVHGKEHNYNFTKKEIDEDEKLEKCVDLEGSKEEVEIHKPLTLLDYLVNGDLGCDPICSLDKFDGDTTLHTRNFAELLFEENKSGSFSQSKLWDSSFDLDQDGDQVNEIIVVQEEKGGTQCSDSMSPKSSEWCHNEIILMQEEKGGTQCSDSMSSKSSELWHLSPSKFSSTMFEEREDPGLSVSTTESESYFTPVPSEICVEDYENKDINTFEQSSTIESRPGINNLRTQRALFMVNENPNDLIMTSAKLQENTKNSGKCHLLVEKIQTVWASALLGLGFQNLGFEDEFFNGLVI
ncbi:hypothetical protein UlMin_010869 [Ulmus minor]